MSDHNLAEQSRKLAACQRVMDLIDTYVERPNAGNRLSIREALLELAAHEAEQQAGEAVAWLVIDSTGQPMHAAGWEAAAHEHINDAISEYDLREAAEWRVVPVYTHPQQPLTDEQVAKIEAEIWNVAWMDETEQQSNREFARAIQRELGITKDTK